MKPCRCLAIALVLAALVAVVECDQAAGRAKPLSGKERQLVRLINTVRVKHGRSELKISYPLARAAERHSRDMIRRGYFGHSSLIGRGRRVGEIIGWGASLYGTPRAMMRAWMRSSIHRSILLSPKWRRMGVGRGVGAFRGLSGAAVYTVDFNCVK